MALLTAPSPDALASLPGIRRGMLAAGNPLSAVFWSSAEAILHKIADGDATVGDVRTWLEATGTEPNGIIGLHVWDEQPERSQLAAEMHTRLVSHLEERLAAGEIDPDLLAAADPAACRAYIEIQERWMTSALPDGRIPMDELLDEEDEEFLAEWDAADAEALAALQALLGRVGARPLPQPDLRRAGARLRAEIARAGWPGRLLIECGGMRAKDLPADDAELWLRLAAGVASPVGPDDWASAGPRRRGRRRGRGGIRTDRHLRHRPVRLAGGDHRARRGRPGHLRVGRRPGRLRAGLRPGRPGRRLTRPGRGRRGRRDEDEDGDFFLSDDDEFDELTMEGLFLPVTSLWQVLGAIDDDERLTSLGWWGLPEAMLRVWAPSGGGPG